MVNESRDDFSDGLEIFYFFQPFVPVQTEIYRLSVAFFKL